MRRGVVLKNRTEEEKKRIIKRITEAMAYGTEAKEAAKICGITYCTFQKWRQNDKRKTGEDAERNQPGYNGSHPSENLHP